MEIALHLFFLKLSKYLETLHTYLFTQISPKELQIVQFEAKKKTSSLNFQMPHKRRQQQKNTQASQKFTFSRYFRPIELYIESYFLPAN